MRLVQPIYTAEDPNQLALSTLKGSAEAILTEGVASKGEIDAAVEGLSAFASARGSFILGPRIFQLWAKRV